MSVPKTILLTGATSGIGADLARQLLAAGHKVIHVSRRAQDFQIETAKPGQLIAYNCDLADPEAVKRQFAQIAVAHPDIAWVINNAALQYPVPLTDPLLDVAKMEQEVNINLLAPALIAHIMLPTLRKNNAGKNGGDCAIINISSGLAYFPKQATALYCATKAGLHSFSQSLRYSLGPLGISVIEIILPLVDTPMTEGRGSGKMSAAEAASQIIAGIIRKQPEVFIGKARIIPALLRFAPSLFAKKMRGS